MHWFSRCLRSRSELLGGPLYYVLVLAAATVLSWRTSAVGIIALAMMCGGDGLADIVGRNTKGPRLPWNPEKSVFGSLAMLLGALDPVSSCSLLKQCRATAALRALGSCALPITCSLEQTC